MTLPRAMILSALLLATAASVAAAAPGGGGVKYDRLRSEGNLKRLATYARVYAIRNKKTLPPDLQAAMSLSQAPDGDKLVVDPWGNRVQYHAAGRTYKSKDDRRVVITAGPDPTGRFLAVDIRGNAEWLARADVLKRVEAARAEGKEAKDDTHKHDHADGKHDRPDKPLAQDEKVKRSRAKTSLSRLRAYVTGHALRNGKMLPATMDVAVRDKRNGRDLLVSP
ncbi:MAG: hypothetical protein OER86_12130, partial [Phycisphaerae bacterium]|nr:hypothetical protein [Phycisphaerae bacterium]